MELTGDELSCKMHFEVTEIDKTKVTYVGAYTREEALKKIL